MQHPQVQIILEKCLKLYTNDIKSLQIASLKDNEDDLAETAQNIFKLQSFFCALLECELQHVALHLEGMGFLHRLQDALNVYMTMGKQYNFWTDLFNRLITMMNFFCSAGEAAAHRLLNKTNLVEDIFKKVLLAPDMKKTLAGNHIYVILEVVCLLKTLSELKNEWSVDRLIHIGMFEVILLLLSGAKLGAIRVTQKALECLNEIFDNANEDPHRKDVMKAQFSSISHNGVNSIEMIEDLFSHKNETICGLVQEILEFHFDYPEEDFYDSDDEPRQSLANRGMPQSHVRDYYEHNVYDFDDFADSQSYMHRSMRKKTREAENPEEFLKERFHIENEHMPSSSDDKKSA